MRSSITLFDDQYKLYKTGSKKLLIAFVEYMFEGIEPDLKPREMAIFNSLRERMDNSNKAHDGRSKGGKNSHGGPTGKSDEKGTKNESNLDKKGTKNEQKMNENAIQDSNGELESSNSGTTAIKRKKEEEDIKENIKRKGYGEFKRCMLSDKEYQKVIDDYGVRNGESLIMKVDRYCASKGKTYKDYLAAIRNFADKDGIKKLPPKSDDESGVYENLRDQDVYLQELIKGKQK